MALCPSEMGQESGPITYSDILDGEAFARLAAHTSFRRLPWEAQAGTYPAGLPHCTLRIQCGEEELYYGRLAPDGKRLNIDGENILASSDLQERILALDLGPDPSY